jgi:hypothetical protein
VSLRARGAPRDVLGMPDTCPLGKWNRKACCCCWRHPVKQENPKARTSNPNPIGGHPVHLSCACRNWLLTF